MFKSGEQAAFGGSDDAKGGASPNSGARVLLLGYISILFSKYTRLDLYTTPSFTSSDSLTSVLTLHRFKIATVAWPNTT